MGRLALEFFDLYYSQQSFDFIVGMLGFFPIGVILAVLGWVLTYTVHAVLRFFRLSS